MARKSLRPQLILPFFYQVKLVGLHIVKNLPQPAGPLDLNGLRLRGLAQPEMQTEIALRNVATTAPHFLQLIVAASTHCDPRANRVTIGPGASELQRNPVPVLAIVLQQTGWVMAIVHQNLYAAIIVEIRGSHTVAIERGGDARASIEGDVFELLVVLVPVKYFAFAESTVEAVRINFGIDVPIGHEQIRPAVVVDVDEERTPTQKLRIYTESCDIGYIGKSAVPVV